MGIARNAWEQSNLDTYGWISHHVVGVGYHTHGLMEGFGHHDFEIVPALIPAQMANSIFNTLVEKIKDGEVLKQGVEYTDLIEDGVKIMFYLKPDMHREDKEVLRVIISDIHNNLNVDNPSDFVAKQINCKPQWDEEII